ncbi:hypothetical protein P6166_11610 [Stenotrophomonas sp. HITSZ_GD]|uniref:hypothetical protein n=1 Tax=Stenotrophomonas sp. HITSZ_GD TaxID=3037248 RepID=UPI00240E6E31|nr:hypothetical protein [Stenotrophomonas sp. HITSZ_GD]MDG2526002.1 hypothetical protein [Stenotrophomonas sp. HITSZ_GD]
MKSLPWIALCAIALTACTDREAERQAQAAAQAQANEQKASELEKRYEQAVQSSNWDMARAYGADLLQTYPQSAAAQRVAPGYAQTKAKGEEARNQRRLQALWQYNQTAVKGGTQRSAMIDAKERVDVDGSGAKSVQLVFRDHPQWKRHAYLVLQAGDFKCYGGCKVQVSVDGGKPKAMAAHRPDTDEAIAMFIDDQNALWKLARQAKATLAIEFPVKAGGTRTAVFETGGLDGKQMPGWD